MPGVIGLIIADPYWVIGALLIKIPVLISQITSDALIFRNIL
jgi:hypothetical protein